MVFSTDPDVRTPRLSVLRIMCAYDKPPGSLPTSQHKKQARCSQMSVSAQIRSLGADSMSEAAPPMWSSKPTMLVGIDVSHPQSFDTAEPSIVGIVASMDKSFAQCVPLVCWPALVV